MYCLEIIVYSDEPTDDLNYFCVLDRAALDICMRAVIIFFSRYLETKTEGIISEL